jgi:hypothetical protein
MAQQDGMQAYVASITARMLHEELLAIHFIERERGSQTSRRADVKRHLATLADEIAALLADPEMAEAA